MVWEKATMAKIISAVLLTFFLVGCNKAPVTEWGTPVIFDRTNHALEDGLRAGHIDGKIGVCDHPFPREAAWPGYGSLYLGRFETGYYKGCAIARKSVSTPRKSKPRTPISVPSRCEA